MTAAEPTAKSSAWPRSIGWWIAVALVMALQVGFIFALGSRTATAPQKQRTTPSLQLRAAEPGALVSLRDPTLFVLPHREGFSGRAWMEVPPLVVSPYAWTEPEAWLTLGAEKLGGVFNEFMRTNDFARARFEVFPAPGSTDPDVAPSAPLVARSTLQVKGDLAARTVISRPELPSQPGADLLANSSVQVLVDVSGNVLSTALLLPPGVSASDADRRALELAKSIRFGPLTQRPAPRVTVGTIIFEWQTIPTVNTAP